MVGKKTVNEETCDFYYRGLCQISKQECDYGTADSRCQGGNGMRDPEITEKVAAMQHTQNALDKLQSLVTSTPETREMVTKLREVRMELAYEIFRCD